MRVRERASDRGPLWEAITDVISARWVEADVRLAGDAFGFWATIRNIRGQQITSALAPKGDLS